MKDTKSKRSSWIKIVVLIVVCLTIGALINNCSKEYTDDKFEILTTVDMGGHIWDQNLQTGENYPNNLLAASTAIKNSRQDYGDRTITWDAGNLWQDTLIESLGLSQVSDPKLSDIHSIAVVVDEIEYDGFSIGNHEYNYSYEVMDRNYNYFKDKTSYVCANIYDKTTGERVFTPYMTKTFKVDGDFLKVGIIGLECPDLTLWDASANYPNIIAHSPENPTADLAYEITKVQNEMNAVGEDCDFIIVSMYNGFFYYDDYEYTSMNDKSYKTLIDRANQPLVYGQNTEAQAYRAVTNTTGVDMFICGSDKKSFYSNMTFKNADESKDVLVVNGASEAVTKSVFRAKLNKEEDKYKIELVTSENLNLGLFSSDQVLKNRIWPYINDIESKLKNTPGQIVGEWNNEHEYMDYYTKQTDYADFINRAQIWAGYNIANHSSRRVEDINMKLRLLNGQNTKLQFDSNTIYPDMSITAIPGEAAKKEIKNGTFGIKEATEMYPDNYYLCAVAMTGAEIKEMLEYNAEHKYNLKVDELNQKTIVVDGEPQAAPITYGLNFHYQMNMPVGHKAVIEGFANGKPFNMDDVYVVMVSDFIINSSATVIYDSIGWNRVIWDQELNNNESYIRNILNLYASDLTYKHGGVYPTKNALKNNEYTSKWYIEY